VTFVLTAAVALSPNDEEIRTETDLMERISKLRSGTRLVRPRPRLAAKISSQ
jgi:hypothetical protein